MRRTELTADEHFHEVTNEAGLHLLWICYGFVIGCSPNEDTR